MSYSERFDKAIAYASELHRSQTRKSTGIPYITHLMAVAALVGENGGNEDEVIAALLHDAVEDQGGQATADVIREKFGENVVSIVLGCTDADQIPKPPWRARKEAYIAHLPAASPSIRLVSLSDKLHNARTIVADLRQMGDQVWSKFTGGKEGTLWYYRQLANEFSRNAHPFLGDELGRVVAEMEKLASR